MEGSGCHAIVKNSDPEFFPSKRTAGNELEGKLRERMSCDLLDLGGQQWEVPRPHTIIDPIAFLQTGV